MKTKIFFMFLLTVLTVNFASSQSLESQLKIIFGDALSTFGKNDFTRFVGKSLSTSGNMKYEMELINAQNNKTININLPQNTYFGANNQVLPNPGYQWANPTSPSDYSVIPVNPRSYPTLPPPDLIHLNKYLHDYPYYYSKPPELNVLFTFNWYADLNQNNYREFSEFNNIKRSFYIGEQISYAFSFSLRIGSSKKDTYDVINFLIQVLDASTGRLIAETTMPFSYPYGVARQSSFVYHASLGNQIPAGKYMLILLLKPNSSRYDPKALNGLKEYFEVLE